MEDKYFNELMESLKQAAAYVKGDSSKCTVRVAAVPDPVPEYKAEDVIRTRKDLNLTQRRFASVLGVSQRTVEAWEAGRKVPSRSTQHLMYLFDNDHSLVSRFASHEVR